MSPADRNISRRSFLAATAASASVAAAIPTILPETAITALWNQRVELAAIEDKAIELAMGPGVPYRHHLGVAAHNASLALWSHYDRIMACRATCPVDLAIKALVNRARHDSDGYFDAYVTRLIDDVLTLAATSLKA